jgi:hypothetical protein
MPRRIAILILAHRVAPLHFLLRALGDRFAVYLHFDARADAAGLDLPPHVIPIARRPVHWGGWSMMQATLDLMAAARDHDVLALVSGDTIPLLPPDALHDALASPGPDRIDLVEVQNDPSLAGQPRETSVARYGWEQPWRFHNFVHWDDPLLNPFGSEETARHYGLPSDTANWLRGTTQRLVAEALAALPPRPALFSRLRYGMQWWALTGETVATLLPALHAPEVAAYFRFFPVPDEHMIQTMLIALQPDRRARPAPMWQRRSPALDLAALRDSQAAGALFARKFDADATPEVAAAILEGRKDFFF